MLEEALLREAFAIFLVFARLGSAFVLMPGIGEIFIPMRFRLSAALAASFLLSQVMEPVLPEVPVTVPGTILLLASEITIGMFMGMVARILMSATHIAGVIMTLQSGLGAAMQFDPTQGIQGSAFGSLLTMLGVVLFFALDLHHVFLAGIHDSYTLFLPGHFMPVEDVGIYGSKLVAGTFTMALKMASPIIVIGLMLYFIAGLLGRLMPQMHVFFVVLPLQILTSFFILAATMSAFMLWYMKYVEENLIAFLAP